MKRKSAAAARVTRCPIGECDVGDVVRLGGDYLLVFCMVQGRRWVRTADPDTYRETSEPRFLDPAVEVEVVRRGAERWPKAAGGEIDPLKRGGQL